MTISNAWNELKTAWIATIGNANIAATLITHQVLQPRVRSVSLPNHLIKQPLLCTTQHTCTLVERLTLLSRRHRILKHPLRGHLRSEPRDADVTSCCLAALEELKRTEVQNIDGVEVLKGTDSNSGELDRESY
jgi:hypothetical protein